MPEGLLIHQHINIYGSEKYMRREGKESDTLAGRKEHKSTKRQNANTLTQ
jgi:hypothetical protein